MRRVLMLAYYFPPVGGGGVQRTRKFVEYLPQHGYESVVVTGPDTRAKIVWAPDDHSLEPPDAEVLRVPGPEPALSLAQSRAERWLRIQEQRVRWWIDGAVATGLQAARQADVIYASMSPFGSGQAAARLSRETGTPWVADLRDPWALDEWLVYTTRLHRRAEMRLMRRTLASAAAIVMNTPEATAALLRHFPELGDRPVVTITNGFDSADFAGPPPERADDAFRIVHAGSVHTGSGHRHRRLRHVRRALGGAVPGLDILPRSDVYLLQAVDRLLADRPDLCRRLEVHLAGVAGGVDGVVHRRGYLPHAETIGLMRSADLLFLPMHDLPPGTRARIVPGKAYEYLATGRPILAAVPDGDARDLLARAGSVTLCRPTDTAAMARAIAARVDDGGGGRDLEPLRRFERRALTADLAGLFDRVLGLPARELVA
jgi:glycosyltransferase involved in cell wall biosynthesis